MPKPVVAIPHHGNRMLNRARTPAITPRKFTRGSFVVKKSFHPELRTKSVVIILSVFDRNMRSERVGLLPETLSAFCNPLNLLGNDRLCSSLLLAGLTCSPTGNRFRQRP